MGAVRLSVTTVMEWEVPRKGRKWCGPGELPRGQWWRLRGCPSVTKQHDSRITGEVGLPLGEREPPTPALTPLLKMLL